MPLYPTRLAAAMRGVVVLCLLAIWAAPAPPLRELQPEDTSRTVTLDPPQQVQTLDPRVCVHTRLADEVEEFKIQDSLRMVREMGATTIVEFLPWAYVEKEPGDYRWFHPDRIIKHAENQGLRVIARLGLVPRWARQTPDGELGTLNYLPDEHFEDFARYVAAFVERYRGRVDHIIIWNEPNLNFEWGNRPTDPVAYTRLLKMAYEAAHAASPDITVLNGALAPTLAPAGSGEGGWNDLDFLRRMYETGAADYFDVMAVHNYPFNNPPQADPAPDRLNFRRIELLRAVMAEFGDADKRIMITETGWNDHPRYAYAVSPAQRINYTLEMLRFTRQDYPWLDAVCIWYFRVPVPSNSYPDYFALVSTSGFKPRPIYDALQAYTQGESP